MDDIEIYRKMQKSPIFFVEKVWGLIPQRMQSDPFEKGKNITFQQYGILNAVEDAVNKRGKNRVSVASGHGIGKAQRADDIVITPSGERIVKDVQVGDFLIGVDGKPTRVKAKTKWEDIPMFRVTFSDKTFLDVSSGHLWTVKGRQERRSKRDEWRVLETQELFEIGAKRRNGATMAKQWEIPRYEPVQFESRSVPIDPYLYGCWLGDGTKRACTYTCSTKDSEHFLKEFAKEYEIGTITKKGFSVLKFIKSFRKLTNGAKTEELRVEEIYKNNDIETRLAVLQGLLGSDGWVGEGGTTIGFVSVSEQLTDDVIWLARSLGLIARKTKNKKPFYYKNNERKYCKTAYTASITATTKFDLFRLKRHQNALHEPEERYSKRWIDTIEPIENADGYCFTVENYDGLYLANNFIVTHNSCVMAWLLLWYLFCYKDAQVPATAPTSDQMHDILWKEVAKWLDKMPPQIKALYEWSNGYVRIKERPETWFARAKTARKENPEALAGVHADYVLYLIDEASGVPEEIFNVAEGALTGENVLVIMISNPTRTIGYFYDSHHNDKENWQTLQYSSMDSPIVDDEYIARIVAKHGMNSDEYRIRVMGEFPKEDAIDDKGYVPLFVEKDINVTDNEDFIGRRRMGIDPAGEGKDKTVWMVRDDFRAKVVAVEQISNAKSIAQKTLTLMDYWKIDESEIDLDGFGVGSDVAIELAHAGKRIHSVNVGNKASDEETFVNLRAEAYWRMREWMKKGGELVDHKGWDELLTIRYRRELNGKLSIMPKKEMRKNGYKSPDHVDSLMLSFTRATVRRKKQIRKYQPKSIIGI